MNRPDSLALALAGGGGICTSSDGDLVSCLDASSGETPGKFRAGGNYAASPVHAAGRLDCFSREGKTVVLEANQPLTRRTDRVYSPMKCAVIRRVCAWWRCSQR